MSIYDHNTPGNRAELLMRQAGITTGYYLAYAIEEIDQRFGEGFAKKNPALVGAFINAASQDFLAGHLGDVINEMSVSLDGIAAQIQTACDPESDTLSRAVRAVARQIEMLGNGDACSGGVGAIEGATMQMKATFEDFGETITNAAGIIAGAIAGDET